MYLNSDTLAPKAGNGPGGCELSLKLFLCPCVSKIGLLTANPLRLKDPQQAGA